MELLVALAIGTLTASGIYLMLRQRSFPVILGLSLLSYAVNLCFRQTCAEPAANHLENRCRIYRPAATGFGSDRDCDLIRDDGSAGCHGDWRLSDLGR